MAAELPQTPHMPRMEGASYPVRLAATALFAMRRARYRVRYPRLTLGENVMIQGRLIIENRSARIHIGDGTRIKKVVRITGGGSVEVGSNTLLNGCWIGAEEKVTIGSWCLISDCDISDSDFHNLAPSDRHRARTSRATSAVAIGDNVWLGAHSIVLKGSRIGADSVVGAGAVVRSDVPEGVVVIGNPAQIVKEFPPHQRAT